MECQTFFFVLHRAIVSSLRALSQGKVEKVHFMNVVKFSHRLHAFSTMRKLLDEKRAEKWKVAKKKRENINSR